MGLCLRRKPELPVEGGYFMVIMKKVFSVLSLDELDGTYTNGDDGPPCLLCEVDRRQPNRAHLSLTFTVSLNDEQAMREVLESRGQLQRDGSVLKVWVRCCSLHRDYIDRIYGSAEKKHVIEVTALRLHSYDPKEVAVTV